MSSITWALITGCCIISGGLIGSRLSKLVPLHHMTSDSKDIMKIASGMIGTLVALVLGLLVASAKNAYDTVNAESVEAGSRILYLDHTLDRYGPEMDPVRKQMKDSLSAGVQRMWPNERNGLTGTQALEAGISGMDKVRSMLDDVTPATEKQKRLLAEAQSLADQMQQSRWLAIEQQQNTLPTTFLIILICWLTMLFTCVGLFAPHNTTVFFVLIFCAVSFSTAIFLIVELSRPLDGTMKISSAPMRNVLSHLGQHWGP